jgi:hypothetical protein
MGLNRLGLRRKSLHSFKQAPSHGHAQGCRTASASVASRLAKVLFRPSLDMDTTVGMLMEGPMSFG